MRVADHIANWMKGINDCVFLVSGGYSMYLNDAIGRCGIKYVCTHHEQAAAIAAEGYARASGRPGLCMVTGGPGGTNAITGLFGAFTDSIPMIFVSGQVRTKDMLSVHNPKFRQLGDQEVDIASIVEPLTKAVITVLNPALLGHELQAAELLATSGRPGPVWIDVPLDVQEAEVDMPYHPLSISSKWEAPDINPIINAIWAADRPVVIVGQGVRLGNAAEDLQAFLEATGIPCLPEFHALDVVSPRQAGPFGTIGTRAANTILREADLMLILGARMNRRQVGYEDRAVGKNAYKIMVDIDPEELDKPYFKPDLGIVGQVKPVLAQLLEFPLRMASEEWAVR
jgi:acetolactate synthase-1/2/3 large subunit